MVCREGSSPASAARTATVFPAPTSPVITPRARSVTHQPIRATASPWAGVAVQHLRGEVAAERGAGEPVVGLEPVDHDAPPRRRGFGGFGGFDGSGEVELAGELPSWWAVSRSSCCTARRSLAGRAAASLTPVSAVAELVVVRASAIEAERSRSRSARGRLGWGLGAGFAVDVAADPVRDRGPMARPCVAHLRCRSGRTGRTPARPGARPARRRPRRCWRAATPSRSWSRCAARPTGTPRAARPGWAAAVGPRASQRCSGGCPVSECIAAVVDRSRPRR